MKNRTIPFGYMMQNGEITTNPTEVLAVVTIFSDYLAGHSLLDIAKRMEVPYSEGSVWNKNMVKRILENEKYLGTDRFPQLISEEMFRAVNEKKSRKATSLCVLPEDMKIVRNLAVCKECGGRLFRKNELWDCRNSGCYRFQFQLTDQMLTGAVLTVLNSVIANPSLLECDSEVGRYAPDAEIIRRENEIRHKMDAANPDFDRTKAEILELAQLKYSRCAYSDTPQKTAVLRDILAGKEQLNTLDTGLLKSCVERISVSHFCTVEVELINGVTIKNTTERSNIT
ncbi:MAG: recombinase family protein [Oscillospiraceae bacterium]|nr:recombinase family protein [Oscillospiraceae bacterium]